MAFAEETNGRAPALSQYSGHIQPSVPAAPNAASHETRQVFKAAARYAAVPEADNRDATLIIKAQQARAPYAF